MNRQEMDILEISKESINEIEPLWEELNYLHYEKSSYFKDHFSSSTFKERRKKMLETEKLLILAVKKEDELMGFCVASVNGKIGEIDSLYVRKDYHGKNIGKVLTDKAIGWLNSHNCSELNVYVSEGNEIVLPFYEQFGFKRRFHVLQIKKS